jgi:hypothetical protein
MVGFQGTYYCCIPDRLQVVACAAAACVAQQLCAQQHQVAPEPHASAFSVSEQARLAEEGHELLDVCMSALRCGQQAADGPGTLAPESAGFMAACAHALRAQLWLMGGHPPPDRTAVEACVTVRGLGRLLSACVQA